MARREAAGAIELSGSRKASAFFYISHQGSCDVPFLGNPKVVCRKLC